MSDEEAIKKRLMQQRAAAYQAEASQAFQQAAAQQQLQAELKQMMLQLLDPKARERLANLRTTKPQLAMQLELYLAQLYQTGQLKHVTEAQLIAILQKITAKPEFKIKMK